MNGIENLFEGEPAEWLDALPRYQRDRVRELLAQGLDYEEAAQRWLTAKPDHTAPFGASTSPSIFKEKLWEELEKFLCGDPTYQSDRQELLKQSPNIRLYTVGVVSAAIAPALGASGVFLAPAVVLLFKSIGRVSLNAWCAARRETAGGGGSHPTPASGKSS